MSSSNDGASDDLPALSQKPSEAKQSWQALESVREEVDSLQQELEVAQDMLLVTQHELQSREDELEMQRQALASGGIRALLIDTALSVRWYTRAVTDILPLIPGDVGRSILDLALRCQDPAFSTELQAALAEGLSSEQAVRHDDGRWFSRRITPHGMADSGPGAAITYHDITSRKQVEARLESGRDWLSSQNAAFRASMGGAPLAVALTPLVRLAIDSLGAGARCAFYQVDPTGKTLLHVTGMSESYRRCVDGFKVGGDSLACGLAVFTGRPVLTSDVMRDPLWREWQWLATDFQFRGCWSFPIKADSGAVVGTFAAYLPAPRQPSDDEQRMASMICSAAAVILSRQQRNEGQAAVPGALFEEKLAEPNGATSPPSSA